MFAFLSGAIMMGCAACGLYFFKYWKRSGDPLFRWFALAFWMLSIERWVLSIVEAEHEYRPYVYGLRLLAFAIIMIAIFEKNRKEPG